MRLRRRRRGCGCRRGRGGLVGESGAWEVEVDWRFWEGGDMPEVWSAVVPYSVRSPASMKTE